MGGGGKVDAWQESTRTSSKASGSVGPTTRIPFSLAKDSGWSIAGQGEQAVLLSNTRLDDSRWHHVIAEADRAARRLTLYVGGVGIVLMRENRFGRWSVRDAGDPEFGCVLGMQNR